MYSSGINGEGDLRGAEQPANPESLRKMAVKTECVRVCLLQLATVRLERVADIFVCTPVSRVEQLPRADGKPAARSRSSGRTLRTESDLRSYSYRSRAQDAHDVHRPV